MNRVPSLPSAGRFRVSLDREFDGFELGAWDIVSGETMSQVEECEIQKIGISSDLLMENAGRIIADCVEINLSHKESATVVVGPGNNGGDGWVAARHLHARGVDVRVLDVVEMDAGKGRLVAVNKSRALLSGVRKASKFAFDDSHVVVDALLGTGINRPVAGSFERAISAINRSESHSHILAVDLPSGIDANSGRQCGGAVRAKETICLGLPKIGLLLYPGRSHAGQIRVANIGLPRKTSFIRPEGHVLTIAGVQRSLPQRAAEGHKGTYGHVLVLGGSQGKVGAAVLAARGAFGIGAGLVTVACTGESASIVTSSCCEAMTMALPEDDEGALGAGGQKSILAQQERWDVVLVGPGLGREGSAVTFVKDLARGADLPVVFDADALHAIATDPESVRSRSAPTILTPHPGEAAVLLGTSTEEVNSRRLESVREIANRYNAVVLLKGPTSLVTAPADPIWFNWSGGPELATAGTGDVLAGAVAGLVSQGLGGLVAAVLGAHVHGLTGEQLAARIGSRGIRAGDVADLLPEVMGLLDRWKEDELGTSRAVVAFPGS